METLAQSNDDIKPAFTFHLIDNLATGFDQDISDIFTLIDKPAVPALIDAYWYENKLQVGTIEINEKHKLIYQIFSSNEEYAK